MPLPSNFLQDPGFALPYQRRRRHRRQVARGIRPKELLLVLHVLHSIGREIGGMVL